LLGALGRVEESPYFFSCALQKDPYFLWGYYGLGMYYLKKKAFFHAEPYLKKCLALNPKFIPALVAMAKINIEIDLKKSIRCMLHAIQFRPDDAKLYHHLGNILILANREEEATLRLYQASSIDPKKPNHTKRFVRDSYQTKKVLASGRSIGETISAPS